MKNLLLLLLLANILYLMWGVLTEKPLKPGEAVVDESDLGPSLEVVADRTGGLVASTAAVPSIREPSPLEAVVGRSCVTVGPFKVKTDADSAGLAYSQEGMETDVRSTRGQIFVGHWVQIRNLESEAQANEMLAKLTEGGVPDAYLVRTEDEGLKISLGLFGDLERAEKIELQALSLELPADITPRTADRTIFFVDIGLPPGKGAGAIVEQYGEEMVLLREAATCPK